MSFQVSAPSIPGKRARKAKESSATYSSHAFLNFFFAVFYGLTSYFYIYAMIEDPGHVPKLGSRNQQRNVITELFEAWRFDEENFCVYCMIRKPLRSKHCRRCARCVSKHDQYVFHPHQYTHQGLSLIQYP